MVTAYVDGKKHKDGGFSTRAERDALVKELRRDGWTVKVGKYTFEGRYEWYWYEATKYN